MISIRYNIKYPAGLSFLLGYENSTFFMTIFPMLALRVRPSSLVLSILGCLLRTRLILLAAVTAHWKSEVKRKDQPMM